MDILVYTYDLNFIDADTYPNTKYKIEAHPVAFKVRIKDGYLQDFDNPAEIPDSFKDVVRIIKENEQTVIVREFGLGLNNALGKYPISNKQRLIS